MPGEGEELRFSLRDRSETCHREYALEISLQKEENINLQRLRRCFEILLIALVAGPLLATSPVGTIRQKTRFRRYQRGSKAYMGLYRGHELPDGPDATQYGSAGAAQAARVGLPQGIWRDTWQFYAFFFKELYKYGFFERTRE